MFFHADRRDATGVLRFKSANENFAAAIATESAFAARSMCDPPKAPAAQATTGSFPRYASFSSAGTTGFAFAGVLDALEDALPHTHGMTYDQWRDSLLGVAGTSAGAIVALVIALGLGRHQRNHLLRHDFSDVRVIVRCPDVSLLLQRFGMEDGSAFRGLVQTVLQQGGLSANSTLADLHRLSRIDVVFLATNLTLQAPVCLRAKTFPDMLVCDAVYASCCMPIVFAPFTWNGHALCDGCVTCKLPMVFPEAQTLFVSVEDHAEGTVFALRNWGDFLHRFVGSSTYAQRCDLRDLRARAPWYVGIDRISPAHDSFDLDLTADALQHFAQCGHHATLDLLFGRRFYAGLGECIRATANALTTSGGRTVRKHAPYPPDDGSESEGDPGTV